jgi:hypothetical protein
MSEHTAELRILNHPPETDVEIPHSELEPSASDVASFPSTTSLCCRIFVNSQSKAIEQSNKWGVVPRIKPATV